MTLSLNEIAEERRFHQGQRVLDSTTLQYLSSEVDALLAELKLIELLRLSLGGGLLEPILATEQTLDAGQEDRQVERLGQVVVGTELEPPKHIVGLTSCREHHHRHEAPGCTELLHDPEAVEARKHDVEQHEVDAVGPRRQSLERGLTGLLDIDSVALGFEIELQAAGEVLLVLDHKQVAS